MKPHSCADTRDFLEAQSPQHSALGRRAVTGLAVCPEGLHTCTPFPPRSSGHPPPLRSLPRNPASRAGSGDTGRRWCSEGDRHGAAGSPAGLPASPAPRPLRGTDPALPARAGTQGKEQAGIPGTPAQRGRSNSGRASTAPGGAGRDAAAVPPAGPGAPVPAGPPSPSAAGRAAVTSAPRRRSARRRGVPGRRLPGSPAPAQWFARTLLAYKRIRAVPFAAGGCRGRRAAAHVTGWLRGAQRPRPRPRAAPLGAPPGAPVPAAPQSATAPAGPGRVPCAALPFARRAFLLFSLLQGVLRPPASMEDKLLSVLVTKRLTAARAPLGADTSHC